MPKVNINVEPIKKNGVAIACGVVAVAAVVLSFYPLGGKRQELQTALQSRAGMMGQIDGLLHKQRTLPAIDGGEPKAIEKFPNETVIKDRQQSRRRRHQAERRRTQRRRAPEPAQHSRLRLAPVAVVSAEVPVPRRLSHENPDRSPAHRQRRSQSPSQADVDRAIKDETARISDPANGIAIVVNGAVVNPQDVQNKIAERFPGYPARDARRHCRAAPKCISASAVGIRPRDSRLGLSPMVDATTLKQEITPGRDPPDDITIWLAQLQLWIQEDVAQGLAEVNQSAKNVTDIRAKHLIKINLPPQNPVRDRPRFGQQRRPGGARSPRRSSIPQPGASAARSTMSCISP